MAGIKRHAAGVTPADDKALVALGDTAALFPMSLRIVQPAESATVRWVQSQMRMRRARLDMIDPSLASARYIAAANDAAMPISADGGGSKGAPLRRKIEAFGTLHSPSRSVGSQIA